MDKASSVKKREEKNQVKKREQKSKYANRHEVRRIDSEQNKNYSRKDATP